MKTPFTYVVPGLAAMAIGGAVVLAPIAGAATLPAPAGITVAASAMANTDTDPLVPYGTEPKAPGRLGFIDSNHDEANTSNGQVDLPF